MANDRRRYARHQRLLKVRFGYEGREYVGVTTDLSAGGAFVNTTVYPAAGTTLDLIHVPEGSRSQIHLRVEVLRVADPESRHSVLPGLGVCWKEVSSSGPATELKRILEALVQHEVVVQTGSDGRAHWMPDEADVSVQRDSQLKIMAELRKLEDILPRPDVPDVTAQSGRRTARRPPSVETEVAVYVRGVPLIGHVSDVSLRGIWIDQPGKPPEIGEIVTIRYPLPDPENHVQYARVVGAVVRSGENLGNKGFAVAIIRIHDMGTPGAFQKHVAELQAKAAREIDAEMTMHAPPAHNGRRRGGRGGLRRGTQLTRKKRKSNR